MFSGAETVVLSSSQEDKVHTDIPAKSKGFRKFLIINSFSNWKQKHQLHTTFTKLV